MSTEAAAKAQAFRMKVIDKIQGLLNEFAEGKLNQEQFNVLYERYSGQLAMAQQALESGNDEAIKQVSGGKSTIAIREEYMGKAIGLGIYLNKSGVAIETLGDFDVSAFVISPVLSEFTPMMESGKAIEPRAGKLKDKRWLLFTGKCYTTVATLFHNPPSPLQIQEIERLHQDFETANALLLEKGLPDSKKMAYPFMVFVQKKLLSKR
jgi:hypothetical protein